MLHAAACEVGSFRKPSGAPHIPTWSSQLHPQAKLSRSLGLRKPAEGFSRSDTPAVGVEPLGEGSLGCLGLASPCSLVAFPAGAAAGPWLSQ